MEKIKFGFEKVNFTSLMKNIIPTLSPRRGKGDNGITAVVGGALEYTGAPYYSAISSLKCGSDVAHIFCHKDAAVPIKSYSPELIVHPAFADKKDKSELDKVVKRIGTMDSLVIGCGLGREESTEDIFKYLIEKTSQLESKESCSH